MDSQIITLSEFLNNYKLYYKGSVTPRLDCTKINFSDLCNFSKNNKTKESLWVWKVLIGQLLPDDLPDEVLNYLIENKICLNGLCHMKLADKWLLKIFDVDNSCDEALLTVGQRYFDSRTEEEFVTFIDAYRNKTLYYYLLKKILIVKTYTKNILNKSELLIDAACKVFVTDYSVIELAKQLKSYIKLLFTTNEADFVQAYNDKAPLDLLAISLNPKCPKNILSKLSETSGIKYAKIIRENSIKRLTQKI